MVKLAVMARSRTAVTVSGYTSTSNHPPLPRRARPVTWLDVSEDPAGPLPAIPASAGALIFDADGRLLILKPTYKKGWTIPGGVMEAGGETPWQACQREVGEETGLQVTRGRLACVDFRPPKPARRGNPESPPKPERPGGLRFLFDCGAFGPQVLASIVLQAEEISESRLLPRSEALPLLSKPVRRRVRAATQASAVRARTVLYLENGRPVEGVTAA
jgi:8-oxo-dGTP pyrophosphatase MutT (NUDIX family)